MLGTSDFYSFHDVAETIRCSYDFTVLEYPAKLIFRGMCFGKGALRLPNQCQKLTVSEMCYLAGRKIAVARS